jgi:hypothetical protein
MAKGPAKTSESRQIVLVTFPGALVLDVTGPLEVFSDSARQRCEQGRRVPYSAELVAAPPGPLEDFLRRGAGGISVAAPPASPHRHPSQERTPRRPR